MEAATLLVFAACAAVLGFATAMFDLTQTQTLVLFAVYLIGGLPAILYVHFIAKARRESSRTTDWPRAVRTRYALWAPAVAMWIMLAVDADDPVMRWLWAGAAGLAVVSVAIDWSRHREKNTRRAERANDT
jgi:hypothetical protein